MPPPLRVLHVITGLQTGGAERLLKDLLLASDPAQFRHEVISLTGLGPIGAELRAAGFRVGALGLPSPLHLGVLFAAIRRADLVETWLYHANLLGGLFAWPFRPVIWSLHATALDPVLTKRRTRRAIRAAAWLSGVIPRRIVACADSAAAAHLAQGYPAARLGTIHNGVDTERFRPLPAERARLRREWRLDGELLVATMARWDPQKDHATLIGAAALALAQRPDLRFLMAGDGMTPDNPALAALIAAAGIGDRVMLLGRRTDVPALLAAADLFVLSSAYGEALPLALCEAMAAGLPAVATDVGDCAAVLGATGIAVPPRSAEALARAILDLARLPPAARLESGAAARGRIIERYSLAAMVAGYEACWRSVAAG